MLREHLGARRDEGIRMNVKLPRRSIGWVKMKLNIDSKKYLSALQQPEIEVVSIKDLNSLYRKYRRWPERIRCASW